jgi:hypothetical protein
MINFTAMTWSVENLFRPNPDAEEEIEQNYAYVEFFPVRAGAHRHLPEFASHIDVIGGLPSVEENPVEREEDKAPDHAPVTATFKLWGELC